jgi:hypothetical protein
MPCASSANLRAANPFVNLRAGESRRLSLKAAYHGKFDFFFLFLFLYNLVLLRVKERNRDEGLKFLATKFMTKRSCLHSKKKISW